MADSAPTSPRNGANNGDNQPSIADVPRTMFAIFAVLIAAAGALLYVQSALHGKFVYDDAKCVVENPIVTSASLDWTRLVYSDYWGTPLANPEVSDQSINQSINQ
jgi:hypothetical protein